jgi:hypothetical protein
MTTESSQLLKLLGSGVRPSSTVGLGGLGKGAAGAGTIDQAPFAELLKQAENGELSSQRRVTVEAGAGIQLNEAQSQALSAAADRAEAAGIRKALVMMDDQAYVMDVGTRTITGKANFKGGVLNGVDGVLRISSKGDGAGMGAGTNPAAILPLPRVSPSELVMLPVNGNE